MGQRFTWEYVRNVRGQSMVVVGVSEPKDLFCRVPRLTEIFF